MSLNKSKNATASLAAVLGVALLVAGCGGGGGSSSPPTSPPSPPPPVTPPPPPPPPTVPAGTLVTSVPTPNYAANGRDPALAAGLEAQLRWINDNRQRCGFGLLAQNVALDQASQDHANYQLTNFLTTHQQDPTKQGFTGVWPWDRAQFRSYGSQNVTENVIGDGSVDLTPNAEGYAQSLSAASYHALSTFGPWVDVGIAVSGVSQNRRWGVQMFGSRSSTAQLLAGDALATFPCEGTVLERPNHSVEIPSPFAGTGRQDFSFGHPLVAMVRVGQTLVVDSWTLTRQGSSTPLANWRILTAANDPNGILRSHQAVLIPDQPLVRGATYVARIQGSNNGQRFDRTYTFSQDLNGRF